MGCRKWVYAGLLWAAVVAARGQNPGQSQIDKSAERVVFFTGNVMLDDGSPPADAVRIEKVCDGRASFEAWTDEKGHFGFKVSPTVNDVSTGDASLPAAQRGELNKAINASSTQYSMPITSGPAARIGPIPGMANAAEPNSSPHSQEPAFLSPGLLAGPMQAIRYEQIGRASSRE